LLYLLQTTTTTTHPVHLGQVIYAENIRQVNAIYLSLREAKCSGLPSGYASHLYSGWEWATPLPLSW